MIVVLLTLKVKPFDNLNTRATSKQKIQFVDLKKLIFNPRFYVLAFFALAIMVVVYAQFGQVGRYTLSFWPKDQQMFGLKINTYVTTVAGFIQMFLLFHASKLINKISPSKSIVLLGASYGVALLVLGMASIVKDHSMAGNYMPSLIVAMFARQLLGLVNPFTLVVVLSYVTTSFNKKIVGIAFLSFNFLTALGGSFGAGIVGGMFKAKGWGTTYCELSGFVFICTIVLAFLMVYSNKYDRTRVMEHLENKKEV